MNHLISIIVPAYNIEKYIGRCLDSILNQTYKNIEVIVVNDGSSDSTGSIIDDYSRKDDRVKPFHKENGGVSSARILGVNHAIGDYIGFVDGDDYVEPEMFEHLLNNALKYNADISHCGYQMVFPNGRIDYYYNTGKVVKQDNITGLKDLISGNFVEPGLWNKLYKKEIVEGFERSELWDSSIKINEDLLMNYILFKKSKKSIYEDKCIYHYALRRNSASTSKKQLYHWNDPLKVIKSILNDSESGSEIYSISYERYLRALINLVLQKEYKEESKTAKDILKNEMRLGNIHKYCKSKKLLFMSLGVGWVEPIYRLIRRFYDSVTGISKKYDVS